jgi:hypothetical protein
MNENQLDDWIRGSVICSDFALEDIQSKRVTGAVRDFARSDETDIMPGRGVTLYKIKHDPQFISPDQRLNIFNPADNDIRRPVEIILYVRKVENTSQSDGAAA